jgi:hypothetical protein
MPQLNLIWDLYEDVGGNLKHIEEHGVESDEVEQVLKGSLSNTTTSKSSGHRITAVVWEHVGDDPLTIYPITAYDAPEPRKKRR